MRKNLGADTISYPLPVLMISTYGEDGKPDVMNAAWGGICSSVPPCIQISLRKERKTLENIMAKKAFVISIADAGHETEADYFGLVSGHDTDKLAKTGMKNHKSDNVEAPIIDDFAVSLECRLKDTVDVGSHMMVIGEIVNISADEKVLDEKGKIDIKKLKPIIYDITGNDYYNVGEKAGDAFKDGLKYKD